MARTRPARLSTGRSGRRLRHGGRGLDLRPARRASCRRAGAIRARRTSDLPHDGQVSNPAFACPSNAALSRNQPSNEWSVRSSKLVMDHPAASIGSSLPARSSAIRSSQPPICCPPMKICGTEVRPPTARSPRAFRRPAGRVDLARTRRPCVVSRFTAREQIRDTRAGCRPRSAARRNLPMVAKGWRSARMHDKVCLSDIMAVGGHPGPLRQPGCPRRRHHLPTTPLCRPLRWHRWSAHRRSAGCGALRPNLRA